MRPHYTYRCPYCGRTFTALPPSTISCPHCSSVLRIDYEGVRLIKGGLRPPPRGAPTLGGMVAGGIIGGALAGPPGILVGGLIGALLGASAEKEKRS